jgi:hypothetical protein
MADAKKLRQFWQSLEELATPEIDHVKPVGWIGDNSIATCDVCVGHVMQSNQTVFQFPCTEKLVALLPSQDVQRMTFLFAGLACF